MSNLPRLKVKWWSLGGGQEETICSLEEAKEIIFGDRAWTIALAGGEMVSSYEELVQAADQHKDKEVLDVTLIVPVISGG